MKGQKRVQIQNDTNHGTINVTRSDRYTKQYALQNENRPDTNRSTKQQHRQFQETEMTHEDNFLAVFGESWDHDNLKNQTNSAMASNYTHMDTNSNNMGATSGHNE